MQEITKEKLKRARWRQRLIDAETGLREGIRADSTLVAYFFCAFTVLLTSTVVGLAPLYWGLITLSLAFSLFAELTHQAVQRLIERLQMNEDGIGVMRVMTTAVIVAHTASLAVAAIALVPHFSSIWAK